MSGDDALADKLRSAHGTADTLVAGALGGLAVYWVVCMIFVVVLTGVAGGGACNPDVAPCPDSPSGMMAIFSAFVACTAGIPAGMWAAAPAWRVNVRPALAAAALAFAAAAVLILNESIAGPDAGFLALALLGPLQVLAAVAAWLVRRWKAPSE